MQFSILKSHRIDIVMSNQLDHTGDKLLQLRLGDETVDIINENV